MLFLCVFDEVVVEKNVRYNAAVEMLVHNQRQRQCNTSRIVYQPNLCEVIEFLRFKIPLASDKFYFY